MSRKGSRSSSSYSLPKRNPQIRSTPKSEQTQKQNPSTSDTTQKSSTKKNNVIIEEQRPGMLNQFAATAAGFAVGSAVGHVVGKSLTGEYAATQQELDNPSGPCAFEIKQFLKCTEEKNELKLCENLNEEIRTCKKEHGGIILFF